MKNLLQHKKLILVLDLDHTLLNSTQLGHLTPEEDYLRNQTDSLEGTLSSHPCIVLFSKVTSYCFYFCFFSIVILLSPLLFSFVCFNKKHLSIFPKSRAFVLSFLNY